MAGSAEAASTTHRMRRGWFDRLGAEEARAAAEKRGGTAINVASWNLDLLPLGRGTAAEVVSRARSAAEALAAACPQADVLCLQEVWGSEARAAVLAALGCAGFAHAASPPKHQRCGLLIASRHELLSATFTRLPASGPEALLFDKGVQTCVVALPSHAPGCAASHFVLVANAHLQSDFWARSPGARRRQVAACADAVLKAAGHAKRVVRHSLSGALLCGDLNVLAPTGDLAPGFHDVRELPLAEYVHLLNALQASDLLLGGGGASVTFPCATWERSLSASERGYRPLTPTKRLDHVLDVSAAAGLSHRSASARALVPQPPPGGGGLMSDHLPVAAVVTFGVM